MIFAAIYVAIFVAIPNRPCKLAAISWRFRGDLSPQYRRDFEHAQSLRQFTDHFFTLRVTKTYFGVPEDSLSQTWRTLLVTRPQKSHQKKEKAPKKARKPSEKEYLRGSVPKNGLIDFASKHHFSLNSADRKGLVPKY